MIEIEAAIIRKLTLHRVTIEDDKSVIGDNLVDYETDEDEKILKKIFLRPFASHSQTFEFTHDVSLNYNVLFNSAKNIFEGEDFVEHSANIAQHLISSSKHPNIKDGDVFVVKFDDIQFNSQHYEGVGIYKFEDKESFVETTVKSKKVDFSVKKGIGNKRPDKACLILFTEEPYTILVIDSNSSDTEYWQNDFINFKSKNDHINNTNNFLTLTKDYITNKITEDFEVSKADQIDFLNRSVDYFKKHDTFEKEEFEVEVFADKGVIESFRKFDHTYRNENDLELVDSFEISAQAVKKQARIFKRVLKLDKNFHIYIHGNKDMIEQGVDENGRKYYKIYYEQEN